MPNDKMRIGSKSSTDTMDRFVPTPGLRDEMRYYAWTETADDANCGIMKNIAINIIDKNWVYTFRCERVMRNMSFPCDDINILKPMTESEFRVCLAGIIEEIMSPADAFLFKVVELKTIVPEIICSLMGVEQIPFPLRAESLVVEVALEIARLWYKHHKKISHHEALFLYRVYSGIGMVPQDDYVGYDDVDALVSDMDQFHEQVEKEMPSIMKYHALCKAWNESDPDVHRDGAGNWYAWLPEETSEDVVKLLLSGVKRDEQERYRRWKIKHDASSSICLDFGMIGLPDLYDNFLTHIG